MKELTLGKSGKKIFIKNNIVYKELSQNFLDNYKYLYILNKSNCKFIPKYLDCQEGYQSYKYIRGKVYKKIAHPRKRSIISIINFLIYFQDFCLKNYGYIIRHNDLSPLNAVMHWNLKLKKVIDWDNLSKGHKYDDLVYIIWIWCNFGSEIKTDSWKIKRIIYVLVKYIKLVKQINLDEFSLKMQEQMQLRFLKRKANSGISFAVLMQWFEYCFKWWEDNWSKIKIEVIKKVRK